MDWRMGTFFEIESISPLPTPRDFGIPLLYILRSGISVGVRARGKRERLDQPRQLSFDITQSSSKCMKTAQYGFVVWREITVPPPPQFSKRR